jgi:hypothetical protein
MTEQNTSKHHTSSGAPIWGIFLLFLGVVLLLQTFNVLPWSLWGTLWRFWPALIIIIGLAILLRHINIWLVSLLTVIILGGSLGIAIWQNGNLQEGITTKSYNQSIGNLEQAEINIDFTAGSITSGNLPSASVNLFEAEAEAKNDKSSMKVDFNQQGRDGTLSLNSINQQYWPTGGISWDVNFTSAIPLSLNIKSTASSNTFDFSDLNLSNLTIDTNASSSNVSLPSPTGVLSATIKANAASMEISLPDDAAARIQATTNISTFNVNPRYIKQGNYYVTQNYINAANRIELEISTNVSTVRLN